MGPPGGRFTVEAVISLGQALGLMCLAEGVESGEQLEALVQLGFESGQVHLWPQSMTEGDARRWLATRACRPSRAGTTGDGRVTES